MSGETDKDSKTEDPSEKKLSDAREKGNTPVSREAPIFVSLLGMLLITQFFLSDGALQLVSFLSMFIENPENWRFDDNQTPLSLLEITSYRSFLFLLPVFLILAMGGLIASFLQNPPSINLARIKPDSSKLSLSKGMKRVFGSQGWMEFAKSLFKFGSVATVTAILLKSETSEVINTASKHPSTLPGILSSLAMRLLSAITLATALMAGADIFWSRRHWFTNLRMTKQEVKDERKQADGDPIIKAKRLSLARDRLRRRMIASVPDATVVITNPTHLSVALRYNTLVDAAPVVTAKGQELIALKIREIAAKNNVPIVENKYLARALYKQVEVDQVIPEEFYRAVAELIHYISTKVRSGNGHSPLP